MLLELVLILQPDDSQAITDDRYEKPNPKEMMFNNAILLRIAHMDSPVITISIHQTNLEFVLTWRIWMKLKLQNVVDLLGFHVPLVNSVR